MIRFENMEECKKGVKGNCIQSFKIGSYLLEPKHLKERKLVNYEVYDTEFASRTTILTQENYNPNLFKGFFIEYEIEGKKSGKFFPIHVHRIGNIGDRSSWEEYFMGFTIWASTRSSCHNVRSGSTIRQKKQLIGTGYNGNSPRNLKSCLEDGCSKRNKGLDYESSLGSGECSGIHSEMNAVGHLTKRDDLSGLTLFTTILPCASCAKNLGAYNIEEVVFKSTYSGKEMDQSLERFEIDHVKISRLDLDPVRKLDVLFSRAGVSFDVWSPRDRELIQKLIKVDLRTDKGKKRLKSILEK